MKVLDHGYIELVESWGSDQSIIEAARMSTNKGFLGWGPKGWRCATTGCGWKTDQVEHPGPCPNCGFARSSLVTISGDEKLLRYLWEHEHATPFEMAGMTVEVKAPIMVFREWHRHRVPFGYNEMSARYVPLPDENYCPTVERIIEGSRATKNRQAASLAGECGEGEAMGWLDELNDVYEHAERVYQRGLQIGVPKELARLPVPVGRYSRMRATANLRGWLGFCRLRAAKNAQYEIRVYADWILSFVRDKFPRTHELFVEGFEK
jgi:thymidylate synthase (FAD)